MPDEDLALGHAATPTPTQAEIEELSKGYAAPGSSPAGTFRETKSQRFKRQVEGLGRRGIKAGQSAAKRAFQEARGFEERTRTRRREYEKHGARLGAYALRRVAHVKAERPKFKRELTYEERRLMEKRKELKVAELESKIRNLQGELSRLRA